MFEPGRGHQRDPSSYCSRGEKGKRERRTQERCDLEKMTMPWEETALLTKATLLAAEATEGPRREAATEWFIGSTPFTRKVRSFILLDHPAV